MQTINTKPNPNTKGKHNSADFPSAPPEAHQRAVIDATQNLFKARI